LYSNIYSAMNRVDSTVKVKGLTITIVENIIVIQS
jgi:hypothetical protein